MQDYRIGKLNGRYVVTWDDNGSRRRYRLAARVGEDSPRQAEAEALDLIRRHTIKSVDTTVAALWQAHGDDKAGRPIANTMRYTGRAVLPHFGALRPDQITTDHCRSYAAGRHAAGRSQGSVHTELGHLRMVCTWAVKTRLIATAPHIERPQKPSPKDRFLTLPEIERLLTAQSEPHVRLAILLLLTTAARVGAALDLTWDRVDLDRRQIDLRLAGPGPRKGRAVVPINATLMAALTVARQGAMSTHVIEWAGGPVKSIRNGFTRTAARAGLGDISLHTLRHTAAVHMAASGVPMTQIAQMLGHNDSRITERVYARFSPDHLRAAADVLDFGRFKGVR